MRWEGRREGDRTWGDRPEALTLGKDGRPLLCKEFPSDMFHNEALLSRDHCCYAPASGVGGVL